MKQKIYAPNTVPTANIAVNKSRLKLYKNAGQMPTYYLQKGQEFQIELANLTTEVVLAKIILNGKAISQGGLVLNPGQRVFLDRYFFRFSMRMGICSKIEFITVRLFE